MRVLFATTPGWGHVTSDGPLAKAFVDRGDEVCWAAATEVCARLEREEFRAAAAGLDEAESIARFYRRSPEIETIPTSARPEFMFLRLFGTIRAGPMPAPTSSPTPSTPGSEPGPRP